MSVLFDEKIVTQAVPEIDYYGPHDSDTLVMVFGGAYADADVVFYRMRALFEQVGRVGIVRYINRHFDAHTVMVTAFEAARASKYKKILLVGLSLGGQLCLRFVEHDEAQGGQFESIKMILADTPLLGYQHVRNPLARYARHMQVGPVFNRFSPWIMRRMFRSMKVDGRFGMDEAHRQQHTAAMHGLSLSAFRDQTVAVAERREYAISTKPETVYMYSSDGDKVIHGLKARCDINLWLGPGAHLKTIHVGGPHGALVEYHELWWNAYAKALCTHGYDVVA